LNLSFKIYTNPAGKEFLVIDWTENLYKLQNKVCSITYIDPNENGSDLFYAEIPAEQFNSLKTKIFIQQED